MTHYSNEPRRVRVDFFKPSGKWYATISMWWVFEVGTTWESPALIHNEFRLSLRASAAANGYSGMSAVCLDPYHPNACPIMMVHDE